MTQQGTPVVTSAAAAAAAAACHDAGWWAHTHVRIDLHRTAATHNASLTLRTVRCRVCSVLCMWSAEEHSVVQ